ncbi:glycosyltransferase family 2 protein [Marilutibacter spongiae]|uniref:Glycosyltransferase family 2 protein n=1 Tax=Marilutibacter spongiae TaxID=2025720 RepID=A0A7W3TIT8_9GAMM|nr:glycosyltransferase family 2 protein [Lysobacter spongiae]MBB1059031.1 glycosyltransferase family 2 protein [Lysobacter spongiae]
MTALPMSPTYVHDYLARFAQPGDAGPFDAGALRARSVPARDLLAWAVSSQRLDPDALASLLRRAADGAADALGACADLDRRMLMRLARITALQAVFPGDIGLAYDAYRVLESVHGTKRIPPRHLVLAAQLALHVQDFAGATRLVSALKADDLQRRYLLCDLANPFGGSPHANMPRWLARVNELVLESGVEALHLEDRADVPPFDRLRSSPAARSVDGPLVTVAVASWCPDHALLTSVRSLLSQTWRNLEVLVIDDASPDRFHGVFDQVAALDPRVRLIRQARNGGTYVARNRALREARGDFFTVQDADDWAHPRRIERQVEALTTRSHAVANQCTGIRVDDLVRFNFPGVSPFRTNESSLLFRREAVVDRIGYYDQARKAADSEFSTRLRNVFGHEACDALDGILTAIRLSPDSLSRSEFRAGWRHPARSAYRRNFERWHDRTTRLRLQGEGGQRMFQSPHRFKVEKPSRAPFDVAYLGDFRASAPLAHELADEMVALARSHARVALVHADSFLRLSSHAVGHFAPVVSNALAHGLVEEIDLSEDVEVRSVVVTEPDLLHFLTPMRVGLRTGNVLMRAANGPIATDGLAAYDPDRCEAICAQLFGCAPAWFATDRVAGRGLSRVWGVRGEKHARWPDIVVPGHWRGPSRGRGAGPAERLVLGFQIDARLPLDAQLARYAEVAPDVLFAWHHDPQGVASIPVTRPYLVGPGTVEKATALTLVDAWLKLEPRNGERRRPRDVLEAMAAGCLPVMDPSWEELFGEAALYADAGSLKQYLQVAAADGGLQLGCRESGAVMLASEMDAARFRTQFTRLQD